MIYSKFKKHVTSFSNILVILGGSAGIEMMSPGIIILKDGILQKQKISHLIAFENLERLQFEKQCQLVYVLSYLCLFF